MNKQALIALVRKTIDTEGLSLRAWSRKYAIPAPYLSAALTGSRPLGPDVLRALSDSLTERAAAKDPPERVKVSREVNFKITRTPL
jgi:hypothetical protein